MFFILIKKIKFKLVKKQNKVLRKNLHKLQVKNFIKKTSSSDEGLLKYMTSSARKPSAKLLTDVTNKLSAGKSGYRYEDGLCRAGSVCGSYTQLVWATSEHLGCGVAVCPRVRFVTLH